MWFSFCDQAKLENQGWKRSTDDASYSRSTFELKKNYHSIKRRSHGVPNEVVGWAWGWWRSQRLACRSGSLVVGGWELLLFHSSLVISALPPGPHQFSSSSSPPHFQFPSWQPENRSLPIVSHFFHNFKSSFFHFFLLTSHVPTWQRMQLIQWQFISTKTGRGWWESNIRTSPERKASSHFGCGCVTDATSSKLTLFQRRG